MRGDGFEHGGVLQVARKVRHAMIWLSVSLELLMQRFLQYENGLPWSLHFSGGITADSIEYSPPTFAAVGELADVSDTLPQ